MVHVGNPCPYGAGACLFLPNEERIDLKQPVIKRSSMAIMIALENIKLEMERIDIKKITLFSDSHSAVGILTLG